MAKKKYFMEFKGMKLKNIDEVIKLIAATCGAALPVPPHLRKALGLILDDLQLAFKKQDLEKMDIKEKEKPELTLAEQFPFLNKLKEMAPRHQRLVKEFIYWVWATKDEKPMTDDEFKRISGSLKQSFKENRIQNEIQ